MRPNPHSEQTWTEEVLPPAGLDQAPPPLPPTSSQSARRYTHSSEATGMGDPTNTYPDDVSFEGQPYQNNHARDKMMNENAHHRSDGYAESRELEHDYNRPNDSPPRRVPHLDTIENPRDNRPSISSDHRLQPEGYIDRSYNRSPNPSSPSGYALQPDMGGDYEQRGRPPFPPPSPSFPPPSPGFPPPSPGFPPPSPGYPPPPNRNTDYERDRSPIPPASPGYPSQLDANMDRGYNRSPVPSVRSHHMSPPDATMDRGRDRSPAPSSRPSLGSRSNMSTRQERGLSPVPSPSLNFPPPPEMGPDRSYNRSPAHSSRSGYGPPLPDTSIDRGYNRSPSISSRSFRGPRPNAGPEFERGRSPIPPVSPGFTPDMSMERGRDRSPAPSYRSDHASRPSMSAEHRRDRSPAPSVRSTRSTRSSHVPHTSMSADRGPNNEYSFQPHNAPPLPSSPIPPSPSNYGPGNYGPSDDVSGGRHPHDPNWNSSSMTHGQEGYSSTGHRRDRSVPQAHQPPPNPAMSMPMPMPTPGAPPPPKTMAPLSASPLQPAQPLPPPATAAPAPASLRDPVPPPYSPLAMKPSAPSASDRLEARAPQNRPNELPPAPYIDYGKQECAAGGVHDFQKQWQCTDYLCLGLFCPCFCVLTVLESIICSCVSRGPDESTCCCTSMCNASGPKRCEKCGLFYEDLLAGRDKRHHLN